MRRLFVPSLRPARRFGALAGAGLLVAMTASFSPSVPAQTQPTGITLACSGNANTVDLSTAPITWGINTGSGLLQANSAGNGNWSTAAPVGNHWIGNGNTGNPGTVSYSLNVAASNPNIILGSAKIAYSYLVDDNQAVVTWNASTLPSNSSTSFNTAPYILPAPVSVPLTAGNNTLLFSTNNGGGPYGLNANITLTFDCAGPVTAPANAPWALWSLCGLMLAGVAAIARRRRSAG